MSDEFIISIYRDKLLTLHCQTAGGKTVIAKPLLLLSVFELLGGSNVYQNNIPLEDVINVYSRLQHQYAVKTPVQYPLYFLENEGFYHLKWRDKRVVTKAPSLRMLKDNVEYIFFEN